MWGVWGTRTIWTSSKTQYQNNESAQLLAPRQIQAGGVPNYPQKQWSRILVLGFGSSFLFWDFLFWDRPL